MIIKTKQDSYLYSEWQNCSPLELQDKLSLLWSGSPKEGKECLALLESHPFESEHWLFQIWRGKILYLCDLDEKAREIFLFWKESSELQAQIWADVLLIQQAYFYKKFGAVEQYVSSLSTKIEFWKVEKDECPGRWIAGIAVSYFRGVRDTSFKILQWSVDNIEIPAEEWNGLGLIFLREGQEEKGTQFWHQAVEHPELDENEHWLARFRLLEEHNQILEHVDRGIQEEIDPWMLVQTMKNLLEMEAIIEGEKVAKYILSLDIDEDLEVFVKVNYIAVLFQKGDLQQALRLRHTFSWLDIDDPETQVVCLLNDMYICARFGLIEEFEERIDNILSNLRKVGDTSQIVMGLLNAVTWLDPSEKVDGYIQEMIDSLGEIPPLLELRVIRALILYAESIDDLDWKGNLLDILQDLAAEYDHAFSLFIAQMWCLEFQLILEEMEFEAWKTKALELKSSIQHRDLEHGILLLDIASKLVIHDYKSEAFPYYQEAKEVFERLGIPKDRMSALEGMANCAEGEERIRYLQQLLNEELSIAQLGSSDYSRGSSLLRLRPTGNDLILEFLDIGDIERALEVVFQMKMEAGDEANRLREQQNILEVTVSSPKILQQFPKHARQITLEEVQAKLSAQSIIFEYYLLYDGMLCIFEITKSNVVLHQVEFSDDDFDMLDIVDEVASGQLFDGNEVYLEHLLRGLYLKLISPIESLFASCKEVFFAVGGFLSTCPFGALISKEGKSLIEGIAFSQLVTGAQIAHLEQRKESKYVASLLGDSRDIPLKWSESEQAEIQAIVQHFDYSIATNLEEIGAAHIVHYTGHGWLEEEQGRNWIQIGEQKITVENLSEWWFSSHPLILLVSCYSGKGYPLHDGFSGFIRTAFLSGASSLVGSDWEVSDEVGHIFAVRFLEKVLGGMSVSLAFQKVVLGIKEEYPHPFFWASFRLFGW